MGEKTIYYAITGVGAKSCQNPSGLARRFTSEGGWTKRYVVTDMAA